MSCLTVEPLQRTQGQQTFDTPCQAYCSVKLVAVGINSQSSHRQWYVTMIVMMST